MGKELLCTAKMFLSSTLKLRYRSSPQGPCQRASRQQFLCSVAILSMQDLRKLGVTLTMLW